MNIHPYLNYNGNCRDAFEYYERHLGGKINAMMKHSEVPAGSQVPPEWGSKIVHARMTVGDSVLMGSDVPPDRQKPIRSVYLYLSVSGPDEAERVFAALSQGGEILMPLQETFWAQRFGMARDQFGALWMISADRS